MKFFDFVAEIFKQSEPTIHINGKKLSENEMETVIWALQQQVDDLSDQIIVSKDNIKNTEKTPKTKEFITDEKHWVRRCENILKVVQTILFYHKDIDHG